MPSDDSVRDESCSGDSASGSSIPPEESRVVSQELITAAVMDALSNPDVIRKIVAAVSPGTGEGSGTSSSANVADGASPLGDMPNPSELASLGLSLGTGGAKDPLTTMAGSATSSSRRDLYTGSPAGATGHHGAGDPAGFLSASDFHSSHQNWWLRYSMVDLLPNNLELARRAT